MRDTSDKIKMEGSRKMEMRNMLMSAPAEVTQMPKKSTKKKAVTVILVAAVVSALGLSVYAAIRGLGDLSFGRSSWGPSIEEDIKNSMPSKELISLAGYADSPEHKATDEWIRFTGSYDTDSSILDAYDKECKRTKTDPFGDKYPGSIRNASALKRIRLAINIPATRSTLRRWQTSSKRSPQNITLSFTEDMMIATRRSLRKSTA